ncbi:glycosyltransferase family 39 protein [uncultured Sphingomonas sp.]|uniref:glycosyltransferase family 39 protein n=1 Tax=uncultured Sphingomonas sp. TaxID=158754 RepID=UPI0035CB9502
MTRRGIPLVLAALAWFSCVWFGSWELNPNTAVRLFAAIRIVEDGTATIDPFAPLTIDKAVFGDHAYLDKAPGMTLTALPAVALADRWTGERADRFAPLASDPGFARYLRVRLRLAVAIGPAVLTALAAAALYGLALALTGSATAALFAALGYALGTPAWGWSTTLLGHAPVAALYVIALWAFERAAVRGRAGAAALGGVALGWAVTVEYQAAIAGTALALFALWRFRHAPARWLLAGAAALGGLAGLAPLVGYNLFAFGTPFRLGYQGVVGFEGMHQGLFGLTAPNPRVLWEITFGLRRGLLWVAPVLVLAVPGLFGLAAARRSRALGIAAAATVAIVLLVNAAYVYWDGGNATGPRLTIPAVGLLALGLAPFWASLRTRQERRLAAGMLAVSVLVNATIAAGDIFTPPWATSPFAWIWRERLVTGDITSLGRDLWGWPGWTGPAIWAAVALPALLWLTRAARLRDGGPRVRTFMAA